MIKVKEEAAGAANKALRITDYKIGSDPEMFLRERSTLRIVSAIELVPGDKHNPYQIPGLPVGCQIQHDNVMVEYCVPATTDPRVFKRNLDDCKRFTETIIPANLEVVVQSSAHLDPEFLEHPEALKFGCDPDFNAWTDGEQNDSPASDTDLRTCGGHVHIGYNNPDMLTSMDLIKALDIFLGIPSVILDTDRERKKMYGKAGAFRFKSYGVEYRSLSNFWLKDENSIQLVFDGVKAAIDFINEDKIIELSDSTQLKIQTCINTGDETLALELVSKFNLEKLLSKAEVYID